MKFLSVRWRLGWLGLAGLLGLAMITGVAASDSVPFTFRPQDSTVEIGGTREVSVRADLTGKAVVSYDLDVHYDETYVLAVSCRPRPGATCDTTSSSDEVEMTYSGPPLSGNVTLGTITFSGLQLGTTDLHSGHADFYEAGGEVSHSAEVTRGSITVVPAAPKEDDTHEDAPPATSTPLPQPTATSTPSPTPTPTPPTIRGAATYQGDPSRLMCDWDGDGVRTPGRVDGNTWRIRNSNSDTAPETVFTFGEPGDTPICGDWDGNGTETPGMVRGNVWYLRNSVTTGVADLSFAYGNDGDIAVVGDWDGDGIDSPGVFRDGVWYLRDTNLPDQGDRGIAVVFGQTGDVPTPADWDANRTDTVGYVRNQAFYIRNSNTSGEPERVIPVPTTVPPTPTATATALPV